MAESIKQRTNKVANYQDARELKALYDALLADLTAIRTSITGITAKLDLDAGVTGTDYASLHDPAALTTTS
jgi:hypothetical protein